MIVTTPYGIRPDGKTLLRTVSDQNKYIRKAGTHALYEEAIDVAPLQFQYEETDIDIVTEEETAGEIEETEEDGATPAPADETEAPGDDIE